MMKKNKPPGVRALLRHYGIVPRKEIGQNFLVDRLVLGKIIAAADLSADDTVVEIGPGLGFLTEALAREAGQVIAIEVDGRLVERLRDRFSSTTNVRIVQGDILRIDLHDLLGSRTRFKVVANLPYYITSAILRQLLESPTKPQVMVLMVQREVAERIVARPGKMSTLSVSAQFYGEPRLVAKVRARAFYPRPAVNSAIIRIDVYGVPPMQVDDTDRFFMVVRAGFSQRRKQLRNSLSAGLRLPTEVIVDALRGCDIDETRRPQTLSVEEWARAYRALAPFPDAC